MAQPGDFRVQNGVWEGLGTNRQWFPALQHVQEYLNKYFLSVSGTGANQRFIGVGEFGESFPPPAALAGITGPNPTNQPPVMAAATQTSTATATQPPVTTGSAGPEGERIADAYKTWQNDPKAVWPPMKEDVTSPRWEMVGGKRTFTGYNTIQDTEAIKQFLNYAKQNNLRFTDASLTGADGTPQAVTIGDQQYFQQPGTDGQFERIPEAKPAVAAPTAPTIETHGGKIGRAHV